MEMNVFLNKFLPGLDTATLSDKEIISHLNSTKESEYYVNPELVEKLLASFPFDKDENLILEDVIWTSQGEQIKLIAMTDNHVKNAYDWIPKNNPKNLHWMYILLKEGERRYQSFWDLKEFRF
jgi:hypothetical protein